MSTRATVWLKKPSKNEQRFLYHHCDGYALFDDLNDVLELQSPDEPWYMDDIIKDIIEKDDAYGTHTVTCIGWDSEFVYVIDFDEKSLAKYDCGLWFRDEHINDNMTLEQEKTQDKYLDRKVTYVTITGPVPKESHEVRKTVTKKIENLAHNIKNIIDTLATTFDIDDEAKIALVDTIYGFYHADNSL